MELTEQHVTRYTIDHNEVPPSDVRWHPRHVAHIERRGPGLGSDQWRITCMEATYNHVTGRWDTDYTYRHAEPEDRAAYFTCLDEAADLAAHPPGWGEW